MEPILELLVVAWSLGICASDMLTRRIPNVFSLGAVAAAAAFLLATGHSVLGADWQSVLVGVVLGLLLTLPAYLAGWLGAGDVKLLLAIGLIGGGTITSISFAIGSLLAGAVSVGYLMLLQYGGPAAPAKKWLPFGSALSLGLLVAMGTT